MASSIVSRLKAKQAEWEASTARGGFNDLPMGVDYDVEITDAVAAPTKAGDRDQVTWTLQVLSGSCAGRKVLKFSGLSTTTNLEFLKGDFGAIDVDPPAQLDKIGEALEGCIGLHIRIHARQGKDKDGTPNEYINYDFKERLEGSGKTLSVDEDVETAALTANDVIKMGKADDEEALQAVIDDKKLDIDQDEYETFGEVADLIIEQLKL